VRKISFTVTILILSIHFNLASQSIDWVKEIDTFPPDLDVLFIESAQDGSVFVGGEFSGILTLEGFATVESQTYEVPGQTLYSTDIFMIKFAPNGEYEWINTWGSEGNDDLIGLGVSSSGKAVCSAYFIHQVEGISNEEEPFSALIKLNSNGDLDWTKELPFQTRAFSLDANGSIAVAGSTSTSFTIEDVLYPISEFGALTKASLSPEGDWNWIALIDEEEVGLDVKTITHGNNGDIYFGGYYFDGELEFGTDILPDPGMLSEADGFVMKYSTIGEEVWAFNLTAIDEFMSVDDLDFTGNDLYVRSAGQGFGEVLGQSYGMMGQLGLLNIVLRTSESGDLIWIKELFGASISGLVTSGTGEGSIQVFGSFNGTIELEGETLETSATFDGFLLEYNTNGNFLSLDQYGSVVFNESFTAGSLNDDHELFLTGTFTGQVELFDQVLGSQGGGNKVFILKASSTNSIAVSPFGSILIFPNPVQDQLFVDGLSRNKEFTILDLKGRSLLNGVISKGESIDISTLPVGTYVLNLGKGKEQSSAKFIKN
jgi:hypothetical protein